MNNVAPIAVFDSGLGGLSVWRELRLALPEESLLYYGDGKNCPYGSKPAGEVQQYVEEAASLLIGERGAKMLVVACNAATAAAIERLRSLYNVPIVGMEPAVKPAAMLSQSGVVGIIATKATLEGTLFHDTSALYRDKIKILSAVGEGFVELVEQGRENSSEAEEAVRKVIKPMLDQGADKIVLGCTHYPFLAGAMQRVMAGCGAELIDPAPAVARRVASLLDYFSLRAPQGNLPRYEFLTAWDDQYLDRIRAKACQAANNL